jgi:hypothetical protein
MGTQLFKNRGLIFAVASVVLALLISAAPASATVTVLFYGNSFTNYGDVNVPDLFTSVALADGQAQPSVVDASVLAQTLAYHISNNSAVISRTPQSGHWTHVILQEFSTKPTDTSAGNPTGFKNDAQTLYNMVNANSPGVTPVLFETWARQPLNQAELGNLYPALTGHGTAPLPYTAAANQMQAETTKYYNQAKSQIGDLVARLAPVGDAFQAMNFDASLYQSDYYHESRKGGLMAALLLYEAVYQNNVADISFTAISSQYIGGLRSFGINSAAEWTAFSTLAHSQTAAVTPEPSTIVLLGVGAVGLLACAWRRRVL